MENLTCQLVDHKNQLIEGTCLDQHCQAPQRIWCIICLKKNQIKCNPNQILTKEGAIQRLKQIKQQSKEQDLAALQAIKSQLLTNLEKLNQMSIRLGDDNLSKKQTSLIDVILDASFSQETWNQIYNVMMEVQQLTQYLELISKTMTKFEQLLSELDLLTIPIPQQAKLTSINNPIILKTADKISAIDCSPNGQHIVYNSGKVIRIYDVNQSKQYGNDMVGPEDYIKTLKYSPDGELIASGGIQISSDSQPIQIWMAKNQKPYKLYIFNSFSPNGLHLVTGSWDSKLLLWNLSKFEQVGNPLVGHTDDIYSVEYSPDNQLIISGSGDQSIRIWYAYNGQPVLQLNGHTGSVKSVKYSRDGQLIVSGGGDTICIWNTLGEQLYALDCENVQSVSFSPDCQLIASCSWNNIIRIWSTKTGETVGLITGHTDSVNCVIFSKSGKFIISGSNDYLTQYKYFGRYPKIQKYLSQVKIKAKFNTYSRNCTLIDSKHYEQLHQA